MEPVSPAERAIASPSNPRVRAAAALRDRRQRERSGRILIDGARECLRGLEAGLKVETIFVCRERCGSPECLTLLDRLGREDPRLVPVTETALAKLAFGDRADGVVAVARRPDLDVSRLRLGGTPLLVVVEAVEKPGNLGAILRSADGAGVDGLIAADPRTDLFNPNAIRASLGTIFTVPVAAGTSADIREWLTAAHIRIVVARVDAARPYTEADLSGPLAIVVGSEATGLGPVWSGPDVPAVRLPMLGAADSLNVSAAAAVLLYEARRQRDAAARADREPGPVG